MVKTWLTITNESYLTTINRAGVFVNLEVKLIDV